MAWNTQITWSPGDMATAAKFNAQIRDNIKFLFNERQVVRAIYNAANNTVYSTVGSWNIVDTTNLSIALGAAFQTGRVFVSFQFVAAISGPTNPLVGMFDIIADSTTYMSSGSGTPLEGFNMLSNASGDATLPVTQYAVFNISGYFTGLTAGVAHNFKLVSKIIGASNAITIYLKNTGRASGAISSIVMFAAEV